MFLHRHDPHAELFQLYQACLADLSATAEIEQTLRYFELNLLAQAGYATQLDFDGRSGANVVAGFRYRFEANVGMVADTGGDIDGATLLLMAAQLPLTGPHLAAAKSLLRKLLDVHLQGRPLKSREVLSKIIKYL